MNWYDAFLQFYRSFYPKENTYNLLTFSHLFSICSALKMIWKSASGMWASAIAVHGCDTTAELVSLPKLNVMRKRSDAVAKKTPRLPAILSVSIVSPCFPPLKHDIRQKTSWNFRQCLATRCFALSHPFAPFLLVFAAPIPQTHATWPERHLQHEEAQNTYIKTLPATYCDFSLIDYILRIFFDNQLQSYINVYHQYYMMVIVHTTQIHTDIEDIHQMFQTELAPEAMASAPCSRTRSNPRNGPSH